MSRELAKITRFDSASAPCSYAIDKPIMDKKNNHLVPNRAATDAASRAQYDILLLKRLKGRIVERNAECVRLQTAFRTYNPSINS
jgi:hypothetical protein